MRLHTGTLRALLIYSLSCLSACAGDSGTEDGGDSGGPVPAMELRLARTVSGNDIPFGSIEGMVADDEGRIFVADGLASEIVIVGPEGSRVGAMGARGNGPGEFGRLSTIAWSGGSIIAFDQRLQRLSAFRPDGTLLRDVAWTRDFLIAGTTLLAGGDRAYLYAATRRPMQFGVPAPAPELAYAEVAADGTTLPLPGLSDRLRWPSGADCATSDEQYIFSFRFAFTDRGPLRAFLPDGSLAIARDDAFAVDLVDSRSGTVTGTVSRVYPPLPLTEEAWEAVPEVAAYREVASESGPLTDVSYRRGELCPIAELRPTSWPVIRTLVSDPQGRLWVESTAASMDGSMTLTLFADDGRALGEAAMPERDAEVAPYVRGNRLWIVTKDALDVQSIEEYEIILP